MSGSSTDYGVGKRQSDSIALHAATRSIKDGSSSGAFELSTRLDTGHICKPGGSEFATIRRGGLEITNAGGSGSAVVSSGGAMVLAGDDSLNEYGFALRPGAILGAEFGYAISGALVTSGIHR